MLGPLTSFPHSVHTAGIALNKGYLHDLHSGFFVHAVVGVRHQSRPAPVLDLVDAAGVVGDARARVDAADTGVASDTVEAGDDREGALSEAAGARKVVQRH